MSNKEELHLETKDSEIGFSFEGGELTISIESEQDIGNMCSEYVTCTAVLSREQGIDLFKWLLQALQVR